MLFFYCKNLFFSLSHVFMANHLNFRVRHSVYYLDYYLSLQRNCFFSSAAQQRQPNNHLASEQRATLQHRVNEHADNDPERKGSGTQEDLPGHEVKLLTHNQLPHISRAHMQEPE